MELMVLRNRASDRANRALPMAARARKGRHTTSSPGAPVEDGLAQLDEVGGGGQPA